MRVTRSTISTIVTAGAVVILIAAVPSAIRDTFETGRVYLFSRQFLEELPQRFTGPGRLRFVLQPAMAILLGWRDGRADARAGRPAYLYGLLVSGEKRKELVRSGKREAGLVKRPPPPGGGAEGGRFTSPVSRFPSATACRSAARSGRRSSRARPR
jgi:hypothetical protein